MTLDALIDMDGTVADWDASVTKHLAETASPADRENYGDPGSWLAGYVRGARPEWLEERIEMIMRQSGFWENLPPIPVGLQVVDLMADLGFRIMVASKSPNDKPTAWTEKCLWCFKHLPDDHGITLTQDKSLMMGDVLFEDWPSYIRAWRANSPDGKVVVLDHPHNRQVSGRNIFRVYPDRDVPRDELAAFLSQEER